MNLTTLFDTSPDEITREFFFNVGGPHGPIRWGIYFILVVALCYLIYNVASRISIWKQGTSELRTDFPGKRLFMVIKYVLFQSKILNERYAGIMHASMFYGFLMLLLVTLVILIQEDLTALFFDYHFIHGDFYLIWSLVADLSGVMVLIGLIMAVYRRYISKPNRLDTKSTDTRALILIIILILTGFSNEAMRIAITGYPDFEVFSPVGYFFAYPLSIFTTETLKTAHYVNWWVHTLGAFTFIGFLATNKLGHILVSVLNIYFGNLSNESAANKYASKLIPPDSFETTDSFGVSSVEEYSWKDLMDFDSCLRCGRCQDQCPAWLTNKPLSPKKFINDLKTNMDENLPRWPNTKPLSNTVDAALIGGAIQSDEIWSCTNCAACMEACPVNIEHVPKINQLRQYKVLMEGKMPTVLQKALTNIENHFNPYGFDANNRGNWIPSDLDIKTLAENAKVDYLFFGGCAAAYDGRNQKTAITLLRILTQAGYKIGTLGGEEVCCGDSALRAGNDYLFQTLAFKNLQMFKRYGVKKIVTTCPHGYNILKKEYKKLAESGKDTDGNRLEYDLEISHHTEIVAELISNGRITLTKKLPKNITYHDSCFLGRYNSIYDTPRKIVDAIPGCKQVEMSKNRKESFCCGAGGSRMWHGEELGSRISQFRVKDALATGADTIATACPFCLTMLSDGIKDLDIAKLETCDLVELVFAAMEKTDNSNMN